MRFLTFSPTYPSCAAGITFLGISPDSSELTEPQVQIFLYNNMDDTRALYHLPKEGEYHNLLDDMKNKWSSPFFDYYH